MGRVSGVHMSRVVVFALLLAGCATNKTNGEPESPAPDATAPVAGADAPAEDAAADATGGDPAAPPDAAVAPTPESMYAECRDRVENPQAAGECKTDADCASAGCGKEVCTTTVAAADIMTTCDVKPCFQVLDTCGCHEGVCDWTLKAELPALDKVGPAPANPVGPAPEPLPTKLPTKLPQP